MNKKYIFAASKPWCIEAFDKKFGENENWTLITNKSDLNIENISNINPRYIFFPHWNWIVPECVTEKYECVCFHMADVPYGRGGSPLQNLIVRGHKSTKLSALKMTNELDAGPVYKKVDLSLEGSAQSIFSRMAPKIIDLAESIVETEPLPKAQKGKVVEFTRRTPEQSIIPQSGSLDDLYDHIRMLDADTYPKAYIDYGDFKLEFEKTQKDDGERVIATVVFTKK